LNSMQLNYCLSMIVCFAVSTLNMIEMVFNVDSKIGE
jgi:hypothetical protein